MRMPAARTALFIVFSVLVTSGVPAAYLRPISAIVAPDVASCEEAARIIQQAIQEQPGSATPLVAASSLKLDESGSGNYIFLWDSADGVPAELPELASWGINEASLNGDGFVIRPLRKNGRHLLLIGSAGPRGIIYGAYKLAEEITPRGVPDINVTEKPVFRFRNGEPRFRGNIMLNNSVFPEDADAILISYKYYPEVFESPERKAKQLSGLEDRQAALRKKVEVLHRAGGRFFTFNYDFTLWNPMYNLKDKRSFFAAHPNARAKGGPRAMWCPSDPATFGLAVSKYRELWEAVPEFDGAVLSYDSSGFIDCDHCRPIYPWLNRMVDYITSLNTALKAINPDVTLVLRSWNLPVDMAALAKALPQNVLFMTKWSVPPGNDFTWKGDFSTNIGRVPRLLTENTYCETGAGMSHMHYAGRRMKEHYQKLAALGVWGVDAQVDTSGIVREVMTLGRDHAAWDPYSFDPSAVLRNWAVKGFGSSAGQLVHDALISTDSITDALILEPNNVGSFQMCHFNPRQSGTGLVQRQPSDLASVDSKATYGKYRERFEIAKALRTAEKSYRLLKQASEMRPSDGDLSQLTTAASATLNLAKTFRDYHLALLNYRMGVNLRSKGEPDSQVYLDRAADNIKAAVTDASLYRDQILQVTNQTQEYLIYIPQEVTNAYQTIVMQPLEVEYPNRLWEIGTFDCDTAGREAKPLLGDEFGQAYTQRWAAYQGSAVDCHPMTGSPQDFPPHLKSGGITRIHIHFDGDLSGGGLLKLSYVPGEGPVGSSNGTIEWVGGSIQCFIALNGKDVGCLDDVSGRRPLWYNKDFCKYVELPPDQAKSHTLTLTLVSGTGAVFDAIRLSNRGTAVTITDERKWQ